jgi:hypothetical protein
VGILSLSHFRGAAHFSGEHPTGDATDASGIGYGSGDDNSLFVCCQADICDGGRCPKTEHRPDPNANVRGFVNKGKMIDIKYLDCGPINANTKNEGL